MTSEERQAAHLKETLKDLLAATMTQISCLSDLSIRMEVGKTQVFYQISFTGWSPTLHTLNIRHQDFVNLADPTGRLLDDADIIGAIMAIMTDVLGRQLQRSQSAAQMGYSTQLPLYEIDHLHTDIAMGPVLRALGKDPWDVAVSVLKHCHDMKLTDDGNARMSYSHSSFFEQQLPDGEWQRVLLRHPQFNNTDGGRIAVWRGDHIQLYCGALPQSVLDSLPGRPLGSAISIHPLLDDRIIRHVRVDDDLRHVYSLGIDLMLAPITKVFA